MPSYSCNLTMVKTTGLIFSLFNVTLAQEVHFAMLLYIQCILHGLTRALPLCPIHLCSLRKVSILWLACDGFNSMEIICNFHRGFFDCRISFKQLLIHTAVSFNGLNIAGNENSDNKYISGVAVLMF